MRPVYQTTFGKGGNCTAACVASLLEVPLEAVPDPGPLWAEDEDGTRGWLLLDHFLHSCGLELVQEDVESAGSARPPGFWIATTDQGAWTHASVWHHDLFIHDPDPRAPEGADGSYLGPLTIINYLICLDPTRVGPGLWRLRSGE